MKIQSLCLLLPVALVSSWAVAADGLSAPPAAQVWPGWHARITVQATAVSPMALSGLLIGTEAARELRGGAVLGDYHFATPGFGVFRATGGLLMGSQSGLHQASLFAGPRLGIQVHTHAPQSLAAADPPTPLPYLGLGFSSASLAQGLRLSADFGLVGENRVSGLGRALLGSQGWESALRDMRVTPMLQLGLRYSF